MGQRRKQCTRLVSCGHRFAVVCAAFTYTAARAETHLQGNPQTNWRVQQTDVTTMYAVSCIVKKYRQKTRRVAAKSRQKTQTNSHV